MTSNHFLLGQNNYHRTLSSLLFKTKEKEWISLNLFQELGLFLIKGRSGHILLAYRHRTFYAVNEAAEMARLKRDGKNRALEKTTTMLEGNNRVRRTRERKA